MSKNGRVFKKIGAMLLSACVFLPSVLGLTSCAEISLTMELSADEAYYIVTDCPEDETEAVIPASYQGKPVKAIAKNAFARCGGLTSVSIPDSVVYIESNTFADSPNLQYTEKGNAKYLGNEDNPYVYLAKAVSTDVTEVTIEKDCKAIDSAAFFGCFNLQYTEKENGKYLGNENNPYFYFAKAISTELEGVTVEAECRVIANYAFSSCKKLKRATIPESIIDIGNAAFYDCGKLQNIILPNGIMNIGNSAFGYCGLTGISLPNSLINIGISAFEYCQKLISVRIPDSVTEISARTFQGCYQLSGVTIGKNVTKIWEFSFSDSGLKSVSIPDGVTTIGLSVFYGCGDLTSVTIPASVTAIGSNSFAYCSDLRSIRFNGTKAEWGKVSKGGMWAYNVDAENVDCTDGIVELK